MQDSKSLTTKCRELESRKFVEITGRMSSESQVDQAVLEEQKFVWVSKEEAERNAFDHSSMS